MQRGVYVSLFLLAAIGCAIALFGVRELSDRDTRYGLYWLLASTGLWAVTEGGRLYVGSVSAASALFMIGIVIGFGAVGAWLYFCSAYAGHDHHRNPRVRAVAVGVFLLVVGIKLTNPLHGAYFTASETTEPFPHVAIELSTLHWITVVIAYACSAIGFYMLFELFAEADVRTTSLAGLVGLTTLPVVCNALGLLTGPWLLALNYEPIGVAAFALGVVYVSQSTFETVRRTGQRRVIDELDEAILVLDEEDIVREANAAARRLFPSVAVGDAVASTLPAVDAYLDERETHTDTATEAVAPVDGTGQSSAGSSSDGGGDTELTTADVMSIDRDGETRHYLVQVTPLEVGTRQVGRALVFGDVTRVERQRRELEQLEQQLRAIDNVLRHNIRNSLNVIRGRADILQETTSGRSADSAVSILERTDELLTTSEKSREIINALTEASEPTQVDISAVLKEGIRAVRADHPDARIACSIPDDVAVTASPMIDDAIEEVLTNAVVHNDRSTPSIEIELTESEAGISITVVDDGPGMSEAERAILQDGAAVEPLFHGSGLGHWLVHWTVVRSGGSVTVEDVTPQGTKVEIRI
jgi:signal transduction histidine kinase